MTAKDATITPRLITALDRTWAAIQARHHGVPEVVITLGSGSGRGGGLKLGHFAPDRWQRGPGKLHELFIGGEGLANGSRDVLATLLHEAAHGLGATRGIQNTSRQGRFHNTRFRDLATELGLAVTKTGTMGWSQTTVPADTMVLYRPQIAVLDAALVAYRHADGHGSGRAGSNNGTAAVCGCGRRIRVAETVLALGPITCGVCGAGFEPAT